MKKFFSVVKEEGYANPVFCAEISQSQQILSEMDEWINFDIRRHEGDGYKLVYTHVWYNLPDLTTMPHMLAEYALLVCLLFADSAGNRKFIRYKGEEVYML